MPAAGIRSRSVVSKRPCRAPGLGGMHPADSSPDASLTLGAPGRAVFEACPPKRPGKKHRVPNSMEPDFLP